MGADDNAGGWPVIITTEAAERRRILQSLQPLFEQARREGLWFWCHYQDLWFSPAELEAEHRLGHFVWGAMNWRLRDPSELVKEARGRLEGADRYLRQVLERVERSRGGAQT